jgi:hypothetical protein
MFDLNRSIKEWRRQMAVGGIKSSEVLDELESHLREDVEQLMRSGAPAERAFQEAVQRVGTSKELKTEFGKVSRPELRFGRNLQRVSCAGMALFVLAIEGWLLFESEITPGTRLFGLTLISVIAAYIVCLPYLNQNFLTGVRGWAIRKTLVDVCNYATMLWFLLLLLGVANIVQLPLGIVLSVVCWALVGAATITIVMHAYGTDAHTLNLWTPEAWQSFELAEVEAARFHHDFIGTEHVLLGVLESENSCVPNVLRKMGVSRETVRGEIEKIVDSGPKSQSHRPPPCTPRACKAIKLAILEAKALRCERVGTEHIFLGLVLEGSGVAAKVLNGLGVDTAKARAEVLKELPDRKDTNA